MRTTLATAVALVIVVIAAGCARNGTVSHMPPLPEVYVVPATSVPVAVVQGEYFPFSGYYLRASATATLLEEKGQQVDDYVKVSKRDKAEYNGYLIHPDLIVEKDGRIRYND